MVSKKTLCTLPRNDFDITAGTNAPVDMDISYPSRPVSAGHRTMLRSPQELLDAANMYLKKHNIAQRYMS